MLQLVTLFLPILDKLIPDPNKRLEAQNEIIKTISEQEGKLYDAMKDVMVADSQSDSKYTKNARPTLVYWSLGMVSLIIFLAPLGYDTAILLSLSKVPTELWQLMTVGIGAFTIGRSGEKMVKSYKS